MVARSKLRQAYDIFALLAVLHLLVIGGVAAAAALTGAVSSDKLQRMVEIMRESDTPEEESEGEGAAASESGEGEAVAEANAPKAHADQEILRREAVRAKEELGQRLAQVNRALLMVTMKREEFERQQAEAAKREEAMTAQRDEEGFHKLVGIFDGLSPKIASEMLLGMESPDEAAKILAQMDERKARKVVEAAKKSNKMQQMGDLLERVKEVAPSRSASLAEG